MNATEKDIQNLLNGANPAIAKQIREQLGIPATAEATPDQTKGPLISAATASKALRYAWIYFLLKRPWYVWLFVYIPVGMTLLAVTGMVLKIAWPILLLIGIGYSTRRLYRVFKNR